jgi:UDP-GlcNAc:undecaprenyl-phosphate GlcNAc-1-phosphate transferase
MLITGLLIFILSLIVVLYAIRKLIYISHKKHLFDEPSENRKIHERRTPNLGGVAIFATMWLASLLMPSSPAMAGTNYVAVAVLLLFILGLTDDLVGVNPIKKIFAQLGVAMIITIPAGLRFTSFYGFFGLDGMPVEISFPVSILFILLITNAFNLIDGINTLAGSIGLLACAIFAFYFFEMKQIGLLYLAVAMCGCLAGFLYFNRTPAKIFMGDTGSLFLGLIISIFSIKCMEISHYTPPQEIHPLLTSTPSILFGLLIIPIFDTIRVFVLRISRKKSPFYADRNHIHHLLIDLNLSHLQSTSLLLAVSIVSMLIAFALRNFQIEGAIACITSFVLILHWILHVIIRSKAKTSPMTEPYQKTASVTYLTRNSKTMNEKRKRKNEATI